MTVISVQSGGVSNVRTAVKSVLLVALILVTVVAPGRVDLHAAQAGAGASVKVNGVVRDQNNAITLPGVPVEVVGTSQIVYTDVDGRYQLTLAPGRHQVKVAMEGYEPKTIDVEVANGVVQTLDVGLSMTRFNETVTVTGRALDVETSSAEAQLIERKQASVISDNLGSQVMRQNGDSNAATAMSRVTGLSVVDNQFIFVRGLGERYSNTTLAGSVLPTTEPDKKVVPLDLFPTGLVDSVQVSKSYSPDRSAEFAGGLVQIVPMKLPAQTLFDVSYGVSAISTATGKDIPLSPLGRRDVWGFDSGARSLSSGIPNDKLVRQGIYTPDVGYTADQITAFGRQMGNVWRPVNESGAPGQNWSTTFGTRAGSFGIVTSMTHSYRESYIEEDRRFFRIADQGELEPVSDYRMKTGTQRGQIGIVGNLSYQVSPTQRLSFENFYTNSGRDEGRTFEGRNVENARDYRNNRLQFTEENLFANALGGEHFFAGLSNSRLDWRVNSARAKRDEPGLRETLYERLLGSAATVPFTYADESQSGFQMFNKLDDKTLDGFLNWSLTPVGSGKPTQYKFGLAYIDRSRDFRSRRFHYIPITTQKADSGNLLYNPQLTPEELFAPANVGTAFRFNEETRPTDAYKGDQTTASAYGMADLTLTSRFRLIAGARVERFDQTVVTQDPFGLFAREVQATNKNTDLFPSVNAVRSLGTNSNFRASYSMTVNRPEFRELAEFEFTDVVGNRAVKGNANLTRARVQNIDARWETFAGGRNILAASVFYKYFDSPIERVVIAAANPIATFQNSDNAKNFGIELEASRELSEHFFINANYTFVDSKITLLQSQRAVQTSLERPLAGQSKNLVNLSGEFNASGFSARVLYNYFGDRISDVGANQAPDIIEQGRGAVDVVLSQRLRGLNVRLSMQNLNNPDYKFTQTLNVEETQRLFRMGRTVALSLTYSLF